MSTDEPFNPFGVKVDRKKAVELARQWRQRLDKVLNQWKELPALPTEPLWKSPKPVVLEHQPRADAVRMAALVDCVRDLAAVAPHDTDWIRDTFEQEVTKAVPSLQRMDSEVSDGVFIFNCETEDENGSYRYGFSLAITIHDPDDDPDDDEPDEAPVENAA